jgi:hypothetical protein
LSEDVQQAILVREVARLAAAVEKLESNFTTMTEANNREERNRLAAGIGVLGSVVVVLGTIIWSNLNLILGR